MSVRISKALSRFFVAILAILGLAGVVGLLVVAMFALGVWRLPGDEGSTGRPLMIQNRTDKYLYVHLPAVGTDEITERFVTAVPPRSSVEAAHACDYETKMFAREWTPDKPSPNPGGQGTVGVVIDIRSGPSEGCLWVVEVDEDHSA